MDHFNQHKQQCLDKMDKSKKGELDTRMAKIVQITNSKEDYYTTSSCSGRTLLMDRKEGKKFESSWIYATHEECKTEDMIEVLKKQSEGNIWFKVEPAIMHIVCRTIEAAEKLLIIAKKVGFKRSGVITVKGKIVVEVMGSERIEAIVMKDGEFVVEESYISLLCEEAKQKLHKNSERINNFEKEFDAL